MEGWERINGGSWIKLQFNNRLTGTVHNSAIEDPFINKVGFTYSTCIYESVKYKYDTVPEVARSEV